MFGISFEETLLIAAIAFLILGPQKLGELAYKAGKWMTKIKQELKHVKEMEFSKFDDSVYYKAKTDMNKSLDEIKKELKRDDQTPS